MTKKQAVEIRDRLNRVIHTANLYSGHSRFIDARAEKWNDNPTVWVVTVENLQCGNRVPVVDLVPLRDGYGYPLNETNEQLVNLK